MQVRQGDRIILDVRAKAEAADTVVTADYYTQLPQLRLSPNPTSRQACPDIPTDLTLDDTDVAKLVECALRHPVLHMRQAVMAAIWNHPDSFRQILQFGLTAPEAFPEIRRIVAEELAKRPAGPEAPGSARAPGEPLLPRMPMPAHLRARKTER
jgi:hypothetical protein